MYKQSESRASLAVSGCETRGEAIAESDFLEWSGVPRVPRRRDWGGSGPLNHAWSEWLVYFAPNFQESCKYCYDFPQNSPEKNFKLQPVKRMNIFYLVISLCFFFPLGIKKMYEIMTFLFLAFSGYQMGFPGSSAYWFCRLFCKPFRFPSWSFFTSTEKSLFESC